MTTEAPDISVVVPVRDPRPGTLERLLEALERQTVVRRQVILVDDGSSPAVAPPAQHPEVRLIRLDVSQGPGAARNRGAAKALAPVLFFTDVDCRPAPDALENVLRHSAAGELLAGETVTEATSLLGRLVAALGFPGGGSLGFSQVWRVDAAGHASSASSCNLAVPAALFERLGGFPEFIPFAAGEDTIFAQRARTIGIPIRFVPCVRVRHDECRSWSDFVRWQVRRGRGARHVLAATGDAPGWVRLRTGSFGRSLLARGLLGAPAMAALVAVSIGLQGSGWMLEGRRLRREGER